MKSGGIRILPDTLFYLKVGMDKKIIITQDTTEFFEKQIDKLLEILGHPEALVTDLSTGLDFLCQFEYPTLEDAQMEFSTRLSEHGLDPSELKVELTLVEICRKILLQNPNWPKKVLQ
jgi:hypothetical protein